MDIERINGILKTYQSSHTNLILISDDELLMDTESPAIAITLLQRALDELTRAVN